MKIITLAKTKELLGIGDTSLDTEITRYIPIVDAKVKLMTNNRYNLQVVGATTSGETTMTLASLWYSVDTVWNFYPWPGSNGIQNYWCIDDLQDYLETGTELSGDGIPSGAYIDEVIYNGYTVTVSDVVYTVPTIILSEAATATAASIQVSLGFNIGLQDKVAKGINWLINQENTNTPSNPGGTKKVGPVSFSQGSASEKIDGKYGMPAWFVQSFAGQIYMSGH